MEKKRNRSRGGGFSYEEQDMYRGGDLGASCSADCARFKLWSPPAEQVVLNLYRDGEGEAYASLPMERRERGVWEGLVRGDLHGVYYDYTVQIDGCARNSADPYARACSCNGRRSMAVNLKRTDPDGWENDRAPARATEQIICEVHVKDFSCDPASGVPEALRGKYRAFTLPGTTLDGDGEHPTCLAYLKRLGVTHVQLMPVFDFGSVDESGDGEQYNWGYDPLNFNVPEGSYSTDPFHGEVRIRELKELVMALHASGIRVVMDVVYNHTYSRDSWFSRTAPGYFYRRNEDGSYSDGSACGNDFASEKEMAGRYILESVLYWAREYHMDGFRFDLMGLLDVSLINRIRKALDEAFGRGEVLLYGEPWRAGPSAMEAGSIPCLKDCLPFLDVGVGVFCDATRDAVKGHVFEREQPGFVNGGRHLESTILGAVRARTGGGADRAFCARSPEQIVTYLSAHDNLTLWDKLVATLKPGSSYLERSEEVLRANRMAAAICYTCQGNLFFLAGEEAARTKLGDENSYRSDLRVNRLDWRRMYENRDLMEYYRGLIAFRKRMPGLCDKSADAGRRIFGEEIPREGCVQFYVDNRQSPKWKVLAVCYNSTREKRAFSLQAGAWELLVDGEDSWRWAEADRQDRCRLPADGGTGEGPLVGEAFRMSEETVEVAPVSVAVFGSRNVCAQVR